MTRKTKQNVEKFSEKQKEKRRKTKKYKTKNSFTTGHVIRTEKNVLPFMIDLYINYVLESNTRNMLIQNPSKNSRRYIKGNFSYNQEN